MKKPSKDDIFVNQKYLKSWDIFQEEHPSKGPILLPISLSIEDGKIERKRIKAGRIAKMKPKLLEDFESHCKMMHDFVPGCYHKDDFETMLDDYIQAFDSDNNQSDMPPSPLDFKIKRPVWFMFKLKRENWFFSRYRQYSMENDRDDMGRNVEKICTLDDGHILLLANHYRTGAPGLKYNLHVTIAQMVGKDAKFTDIIIDPGMDNDDQEAPPPPPPPPFP